MNHSARPDSADGIIPIGVAHYQMTGPVETRDYAFLLLPRFTLLAFSSAVEPLRIANQLTQRPLYRWRMLSQDGRPVHSSAGVSVEVDAALGKISRKVTVLVCSGTDAAHAADRNTLDWLRNHAAHGGPLGAICTGAFTLVRAGLKGHQPYTVHWENQPGFSELFGRDPSPQIYVIEPKLMTCGGGAAATDMLLEVIEQDHGPALAGMVGDMCLHGATRKSATHQLAATAQITGPRNRKMLSIIRAMRDSLESPMTVPELAKSVGLSLRQMERQFQAQLSQTPAHYYRMLKLERARGLLLETDLTVNEIALASGFSCANSLAKVYRAHYGMSPSRSRAITR